MKRKINAMLLEFSFSNFKSYKNRVTFSALASNDKSDLEYTIENNHKRFLKTGVIYGANGSGKSNLLEALNFMRSLVNESVNNQPGALIIQKSHKLLSNNNPTEFDIQFIKNGIRYAYGFSLLNNKIFEEYLYYFPKNKQAKVFSRNNEKVIFGSTFKEKFTNALEALKENRLFLSCAANFNKNKVFENAFTFFSRDIVFLSSDSLFSENWLKYTISSFNNDAVIKKVLLDILKGFGTGITDFSGSITTQNVEPPEELKSIINFNNGNFKQERFDVKIDYEQFSTDLMTEESMGIKKFFTIFGPILDIIKNNKILVCDELESSFHESIVFEIVKLFKGGAKLGNTSQLFFTTHNSSLLDLTLFRRDQIWFTELDSERSTDLYSLSEIKNVRKDDNVSKGYIKGKYGAIPILNEGLINSIYYE